MWDMAIAAGSSLLSGALGSSSAKKAAQAQADAAAAATRIQEQSNRQIRSDLAPYRDVGSGSVSKLAYLLGVGPRGDSDAELRAALLPLYKSADAKDGDGVDGVGLAAAIARAKAAREGVTDADYGSLLQQFTGENLESDPGYTFARDQGQQALDRRLQAGGGYFSGAALKAASRYNNDFATTKFDQAYARDAQDKNRLYSFLSGGASMGQNAAVQTGSAGQSAANNIAQTTNSLGDALGAAEIARGNAFSSAINGGINSYRQNELINKILDGNKGFGASKFGGGGLMDSLKADGVF